MEKMLTHKEQITCSSFYTYLREADKTLFDLNNIELQKHKWHQEYAESPRVLDRLYLYNKYNNVVVDDIISKKENLQESLDYIAGVFADFNELDRMFDALYIKEYDPIANVDGIITETHSGTDVFNTERNYDFGKHVNDMKTTSGGYTDVKNGTDKVSHAGSTVDMHDVKPNLSSSDYVSQTRDTTEIQDVTDTTTYNSNVKRTFDTLVENTEEQNSGTDTNRGEDTTQYGHVITTKRNGNIGVTTTQHMITEEMQLRINYRFWDLLYSWWIEWFTQGIFKRECDCGVFYGN